MDAILGVVRNGRVEVEAPADWPEGAPVRVELGLNGQANCDDEQPETPEEIEAWIQRFREIEPVVMTPEEEEVWKTARREQKEFDARTAAEREKRLKEIFE